MLKFFANPETTSYLRSLADEFGESTNSVRVELNRLSEAKLLTSRDEGRMKVYQANNEHPLFCELQSMVRKFMGIDQLSTTIFDKVSALGTIEQAYLIGDYARGVDAGIIDIVIIGAVDEQALNELIGKAEVLVQRKIKVSLFPSEQLFNKAKTSVLIWDKDHQ